MHGQYVFTSQTGRFWGIRCSNELPLLGVEVDQKRREFAESADHQSVDHQTSRVSQIINPNQTWFEFVIWCNGILCFPWTAGRVQPRLVCRSEGCNRTRARENFGEWVQQVQHDEERACRIKAAISGYRPACWKFDCCERTHLRHAQQVLHVSLVKTLIREVEALVSSDPGTPASTKILVRMWHQNDKTIPYHTIQYIPWPWLFVLDLDLG